MRIRSTLKSRNLKDMRKILDDHGMKYVELEFLKDWSLEEERKNNRISRKRNGSRRRGH